MLGNYNAPNDDRNSQNANAFQRLYKMVASDRIYLIIFWCSFIVLLSSVIFFLNTDHSSKYIHIFAELIALSLEAIFFITILNVVLDNRKYENNQYLKFILLNILSFYNSALNNQILKNGQINFSDLSVIGDQDHRNKCLQTVKDITSDYTINPDNLHKCQIIVASISQFISLDSYLMATAKAHFDNNFSFQTVMDLYELLRIVKNNPNPAVKIDQLFAILMKAFMTWELTTDRTRL